MDEYYHVELYMFNRYVETLLITDSYSEAWSYILGLEVDDEPDSHFTYELHTYKERETDHYDY